MQKRNATRSGGAGASATRRTGTRRTQGRSARVVAEVLRAAAEELGRVGYEALRIEDVALRSGVNKTTIYRRWPTKLDLIAAVIADLAPVPDVADTGTVRGDLGAQLRHVAARAASPLGRGLIRVLQAERLHPDVDRLTRDIRSHHAAARRAAVERAVRRGELPEGTDGDLVATLCFAPVVRKALHDDTPVDDAFLEAVLDVVLAGARAGAAVRRTSGADAQDAVRRGRTGAPRRPRRPRG